MDTNKIAIKQQFNFLSLQINYANVFFATKLCSFLIVFGTALAHFTGNEPYGSWLKNASTAQLFIGIALLFSSGLYVIHKEIIEKHKLQAALFLAPVLLTFNSICSFIDAGYVPEQLIEHAIKIGVPTLYAFTFLTTFSEGFMITLIKWLTSITFIGHAIFALGIHYVPGNFIAMTQAILKLSSSQTINFLFVIGILDIVFALLIFTNGKIQKIALYYLIIWGFLTAFARLFFPFCAGNSTLLAIENGFLGTLCRLPHGLLPLLLLKYYTKK